MRRVLVTGASGFLGSHLLGRLAGSNVRVRAAYSPRAQSANTTEAEGIAVDITDADAVMAAVEDQDVVIHAAAKMHVEGPHAAEIHYRVNVEGTNNIVRACKVHGVDALVFVSSTATLGVSPDPSVPADESYAVNHEGPATAYAATKRQAEELVMEAASTLRTIVACPGYIFGRHRGGFRGGTTIDRFLTGLVVPITSGGLSAVHVEDVVDGLIAAVDHGRSGERYILSGENVSFRTIAATVFEVTGNRRRVVNVPDRIRDFLGSISTFRARRRGDLAPSHLQAEYAYRFYSSEKATRELAYQPRPFRTIVEEYVSYLIEQAAR